MEKSKMAEEGKTESSPSLGDEKFEKNLKVGLDVDGVLCEREVTRTPEECVGVERSRVPVPSHEHEIYIVSSRTKDMGEETRVWLAENGVEYEKLILLEEDSFEGLSEGEIEEKQASFKASAVSELDLDVYVEDQPNVRDHLREHCPDCIVLSPSEAQKAWRFSGYEAD
ncbi:hypothetical protein AKJ40_00755 [candidate division MSBL1 archaeon SCGC-AAA259M10]|uniref:FCP1 homology domain-containing protein n=1 Tax=candidate division MSBL1 archaeon SCGC-AAA259M10 TaxID=1698270 RepID=A0A133V2R8_9EURY|nr:hypothetical protein AKJ40_00755 [candidate division MSBL1 archaeon SCGC-AAA259M10]